MTEVLHLQSRAYPLHFGSLDLSPRTIAVPDRGDFRAVPGMLGSLAYNTEATVEADITDLIRPAVDVPEVEIVQCRVRVLGSGVVLVVYALRHKVDLRTLALRELDELDARINNQLRNADGPLLQEVLATAIQTGLLADLVRPPAAAGEQPTTIDRRSVRYNCHFITRNPPWTPDRRVPELVLGPRCRILLPYTYAWDADPAMPLDDILTMFEPADCATAQLSLLLDASLHGRRVLADLAQANIGNADAHAFRRFLDRLWADYYHLDSYRIESGQEHRATFLAARTIIGLDGAHDRAERMLHHVSSSLQAESALRSAYFDTRLNRIASGLTVVAAAAFALDIAVFLLPDVSWPTRLGTVSGVIALAAALLAVAVFTAGSRRK